MALIRSIPGSIRLRALWGLCATMAALVSGCGPAPAPRPDAPVRVVSLAPNLTEIVCAVGAADTLVGRTDFCTYPPNVVSNVPVIGGFGQPSLELLVAARPTHVIEVDLEDETIGRRIGELGIAHRRIPCRSLDDIPRAIHEVGRIVRHSGEADAMAAQMAARIGQLRSTPASTNAPRVFVEIWSDPLMTAGRDSFVADLIRLAGGRNVGDAAEQDYYEVSNEWVITQNPDVIVCLVMAGTVPARELAMKRPGWDVIRAVRAGRVYDRLPHDILTRPGPRVLDGIEQLRMAIQGGEQR